VPCRIRDPSSQPLLPSHPREDDYPSECRYWPHAENADQIGVLKGANEHETKEPLFLETAREFVEVQVFSQLPQEIKGSPSVFVL